MYMEILGEVLSSNNNVVEHSSNLNVVKGKRTKRQRALSPFATNFPMTTTTSSSSGGGGGGGGGRVGGGLSYCAAGGGGDHERNFMTSPTTSIEFGESTEEEEDMANCLILLAQGHSPNIAKRIEDGGGVVEKFNSRRFTEAATTTKGKAGYYVYECKTCNRCFPSFQALGGHRASHKKPKAMNVEEKKALMLLDDDAQFTNNGPSLSLQISNRAMFNNGTTNNKSKVHECSICGSEFSSGQALGGHMRRHRSTNTATTTTTMTTAMDSIMSESQDNKKTKNLLSLDLNLPAPEDDRDNKFPYTSKQQLVYSASSLVDCHY